MGLARHLTRLISTQIRSIATAPKPKNHYDSLGIAPQSTQSEIKSAYYKLSMVYHPDRNKDEASHQKFRDITEAYEVLGNIKTRKLYDRGLYFSPRIRTTSEFKEEKFHKSRETKSRAPPPEGRTPIYDYDEWAKNHYGETFRRKMENKKRAQDYRDYRQKEVHDKKLQAVVFVVTSILLICTFYTHDRDYDTVAVPSLGMLTTNKSSSNNRNDDE